MPRFYDLEGNEICKECFVENYKALYFSGFKTPKSTIKANSRVAEKIIEKVLLEGIKSEKDVKDIMAWKMSKIDSCQTWKQGTIKYAQGWIDSDGKALSCRRWHFHINIVAKQVLELVAKEQGSPMDPQFILDRLKKCLDKEDGIGTTYMVTLLYFIKKGQYPIYDQFADRAVTAIREGVVPCTQLIDPIDLPSRKENRFDRTIEILQQYVRCIECIFGLDYYDSRKYDRALWVYGHFFN